MQLRNMLDLNIFRQLLCLCWNQNKSQAVFKSERSWREPQGWKQSEVINPCLLYLFVSKVRPIIFLWSRTHTHTDRHSSTTSAVRQLLSVSSCVIGRSSSPWVTTSQWQLWICGLSQSFQGIHTSSLQCWKQMGFPKFLVFGVCVCETFRTMPYNVLSGLVTVLWFAQ